MATQISSGIGRCVYIGGIVGCKVFVDYGFAKYFMSTPAKTAALFGALEGVVTFLVMRPLFPYIVEKDNDTFSSICGKVVALPSIAYLSYKAVQMLLTLAKYPISNPEVLTLGLVNNIVIIVITAINIFSSSTLHELALARGKFQISYQTAVALSVINIAAIFFFTWIQNEMK